MAGTGTLIVTPATSGTTINTLPPSGQASGANSIPVVLDTGVETPPGTAGASALTMQGNAAGIPLPAAIADGKLTSLGALADTVWDGISAAASAIAILKRIAALVLGAGENHVGAVGGESAHPIATPVATALTYAAGRCIGGPVPLTGFLRLAGKSALIQSLILRSLDVISAPIDVYFFRGMPTNTAGLADNVAFAVAQADIPLLSRRFSFVSYDSVGGGTIATLDGVGKYMGLAAGKDAVVQLVARGAVTFTNAGNLSVSAGLSQD